MCAIFIAFPRGLMNVLAGFDDGRSGEIFCNSMSFSFANLVSILKLNGGPLSEM